MQWGPSADSTPTHSSSCPVSHYLPTPTGACPRSFEHQDTRHYCPPLLGLPTPIHIALGLGYPVQWSPSPRWAAVALACDPESLADSAVLAAPWNQVMSFSVRLESSPDARQCSCLAPEVAFSGQEPSALPPCQSPPSITQVRATCLSICGTLGGRTGSSRRPGQPGCSSRARSGHLHPVSAAVGRPGAGQTCTTTPEFLFGSAHWHLTAVPAAFLCWHLLSPGPACTALQTSGSFLGQPPSTATLPHTGGVHWRAPMTYREGAGCRKRAGECFGEERACAQAEEFVGMWPGCRVSPSRAMSLLLVGALRTCTPTQQKGSGQGKQ